MFGAIALGRYWGRIPPKGQSKKELERKATAKKEISKKPAAKKEIDQKPSAKKEIVKKPSKNPAKKATQKTIFKKPSKNPAQNSAQKTIFQIKRATEDKGKEASAVKKSSPDHIDEVTVTKVSEVETPETPRGSLEAMEAEAVPMSATGPYAPKPVETPGTPPGYSEHWRISIPGCPKGATKTGLLTPPRDSKTSPESPPPVPNHMVQSLLQGPPPKEASAAVTESSRSKAPPPVAWMPEDDGEDDDSRSASFNLDESMGDSVQSPSVSPTDENGSNSPVEGFYVGRAPGRGSRHSHFMH